MKYKYASRTSELLRTHDLAVSWKAQDVQKLIHKMKKKLLSARHNETWAIRHTAAVRKSTSVRSENTITQRTWDLQRYIVCECMEWVTVGPLSDED